MISKKKSQLNIRQSYLSSNDIVSISKLLKIGLSLTDSLKLIENKTNIKIFEEIDYEISLGKDMKYIFSRHLKGYLKDHFLIFFDYLSFSESLSLSIVLKEEHNKLLNTLIKKLIYPVGLFLASFTGIYIFNNYFFDSLMNTLNSFTDGLDYLYTFKTIISIITSIILFLMLIILIAVLYFIKPKNYIFGYAILCRYFKNNIIKRYITNELIIYFKEMYAAGLKSKQIFENLRRLKNSRIISNIAAKIDNRLNEGMSFFDAMQISEIDKSFNHFVVLMDKSENVIELLEDYYEVNEDYFMSMIKKMTGTVEIISYTMIIFFIFFIYQVILSPLNMLAGI